MGMFLIITLSVVGGGFFTWADWYCESSNTRLAKKIKQGYYNEID